MALIQTLPFLEQAGNEALEQAWPGNPLGLNVRVPTPVKKGDAYRSGTHYKSKFDPTVAPTNSTIALEGSTIPGCTNITGTEAKSKAPQKAVGFFGKALGSYKANVSKFLTAHEKHPPLAFPARYHYPDEVSTSQTIYAKVFIYTCIHTHNTLRMSSLEYKTFHPHVFPCMFSFV